MKAKKIEVIESETNNYCKYPNQCEAQPTYYTGGDNMMNFEEYKTKVKELYKEYLKKETELQKAYALDHNNVQIGDVIRDHQVTGMVVRFQLCRPSCDGPPSLSYYCERRLKDGSVGKKCEPVVIFQGNIKKIVKRATS